MYWLCLSTQFQFKIIGIADRVQIEAFLQLSVLLDLSESCSWYCSPYMHLKTCQLIYLDAAFLLTKTKARLKGASCKCDDVRMLQPNVLFQMLGDLNRLYIIYVNNLISTRDWYLPCVQFALFPARTVVFMTPVLLLVWVIILSALQS